jgi:hypothetical protein
VHRVAIGGLLRSEHPRWMLNYLPGPTFREIA